MPDLNDEPRSWRGICGGWEWGWQLRPRFGRQVFFYDCWHITYSFGFFWVQNNGL